MTGHKTEHRGVGKNKEIIVETEEKMGGN